MSGEPTSNVTAATMAGSPDSAESIAAATSDSSNAPGRATKFSSHSATPSTTASRDPRKEPIPAPGAPGSSSSSSSSSTQQQQQQLQPPGSSGQASEGGGGKSMFDETPEQAAEKKDYLRKLSSGNKEAVKKFEEDHKDDKEPPQLDTSKPVNPNAQMDLEKWGSEKDPVYNSKAAAKDDYYVPAHSQNEEVQEDVTVAATKLLLADPTDIAKAAKEKETIAK